jgi:hypothetical protein
MKSLGQPRRCIATLVIFRPAAMKLGGENEMDLVSRRHMLAGLAALAAVRPALATPTPEVEVWKNRGCGCCTAWARHLERAGFVVAAVHEVDDAAAIGAAAGVPADLSGCHTAKVGDYVIEGHVPAMAMHRLLAERPPLVGLAVAGMPLGSPGMEIEGEPGESFDVIAFAADGSRFVFMAVRP